MKDMLTLSLLNLHNGVNPRVLDLLPHTTHDRESCNQRCHKVLGLENTIKSVLSLHCRLESVASTYTKNNPSGVLPTQTQHIKGLQYMDDDKRPIYTHNWYCSQPRSVEVCWSRPRCRSPDKVV